MIICSSKSDLVAEVIEKLRYFAKLYGIQSLFVVGGYCRDTYLGRTDKIHDIDVASIYHEQSLQIGGLFASEVLHVTPKYYKQSGTAAMEYVSGNDKIMIEFQGRSSNAYMHNQEIKDWFHDNHIEDVPLANNIYGRDFTMNTLLYYLYEDRMFDPLERAVKDIDDKRINTILPAALLVKYNPLSILRAIRFSLEYDFMIDQEMRDAMKDSKNLLVKHLSMDRILKELIRILHIDGPKGLEELKKFGLDRLLLQPQIKEHLNLEISADA